MFIHSTEADSKVCNIVGTLQCCYNTAGMNCAVWIIIILRRGIIGGEKRKKGAKYPMRISKHIYIILAYIIIIQVTCRVANEYAM